MKKLLGILALTLAISGLSLAEQDVLKKFNVQTELRTRYTDQFGENSNRNGNPGFSGVNKTRSRWRNTINGQISLVDEWGLDANFRILRNGDRNYTTNGKNKDNFYKSAVREAWETEFFLTKDIKIGNIDTKWKLGWENKTNRVKQSQNKAGTWKNDLSGDLHTVGYSNEFYFGPSATFKVLGHSIDTSFQAVYFNIHSNKTGDYYLTGNDLEAGKADGYGFNLDLGTTKNFLSGKAGTVKYYIDLVNKFRDANGKIADTGKSAKSNMYLDYIAGLTYTTPSFKGFYGEINLENEWEKYTAKTGYENTFSVWTNIGYKTSFDTAVGKITVTPTIKYSPVYKYTVKEKDDRTTTELNELRAGVVVGFTAK